MKLATRRLRNWRFVFFGYGCEYVLGALCAHMRGLGLDCVEIDGMEIPAVAALREARSPKRIALVSSQHFFLGRQMREGLGADGCYSLLEAAAVLSPAFICYGPHDLSEPVLPHEIPYLGIVDLYLAASRRERALSRYCEVVEVGWIKSKAAAEMRSPALRNDAIWLFSKAEELSAKLGLEETCARIAAAAGELCSVKVAKWSTSDEMEEGLRRRGVAVVDSGVATPPLIRACRVVVTNGPSSVAFEAAAEGKRTIVVTDPRLTTDFDRDKFWKYLGLEGLEYVTALSESDLGAASAAEATGAASRQAQQESLPLSAVAELILERVSRLS